MAFHVFLYFMVVVSYLVVRLVTWTRTLLTNISSLTSPCFFFCIFDGVYGDQDKENRKFRSQMLERPSIGEYWNISGVTVLPENVIFTFFRMCWCYSEAYNTETQKWSSVVQNSCTSIWALKYTFFQEDKVYAVVNWHRQLPSLKIVRDSMRSRRENSPNLFLHSLLLRMVNLYLITFEAWLILNEHVFHCFTIFGQGGESWPRKKNRLVNLHPPLFSRLLMFTQLFWKRGEHLVNLDPTILINS